MDAVVPADGVLGDTAPGLVSSQSHGGKERALQLRCLRVWVILEKPL
jgi:hypothetical protein